MFVFAKSQSKRSGACDLFLTSNVKRECLNIFFLRNDYDRDVFLYTMKSLNTYSQTKTTLTTRVEIIYKSLLNNANIKLHVFEVRNDLIDHEEGITIIGK